MKLFSRTDNSSSYWETEKGKFISKAIISIIFGLLGFIINFHTIHFSLPPYTASVLIGLLFPLLITLAWGWKYGLISALFGGCQSMWWIWGPSNGYATFAVVPSFTLWVVWHGLFADYRKKHPDHKWWVNKYTVEVPFRVLSTINLYTLCRWAITFNPPQWNWASNASNSIPMQFSNFVVLKQAVVAYVILLLADLLLNLGFVRKIFGLKEDYDQTNTSYIIIASILLGVLFWIAESTLDYLFFYADKSFLDLLVLDVPLQEIYIRTMFFLACLIGGLLAAKILRRQRESDRDLYESEERFRLLVQNMPVLINAFGADDNLLFWNRECEIATGYSAQEIIGNPNAMKLLYPDPAYLQPVMEEWVEGGDDFQNWDMVITCKDGSPRTISWTNISDLFPIPGWKSWAIGVDMTEKKQAEEKLKEYSEHLEEMMEERTKELRDAQERLFRREKLALLGQMAGGVAHELRNPLGVISNAVYYLQMVIEDADDTTREYLDLISSEINNSNKIMNDLLDISRTRSAEREKVDSSDLIAQALVKKPSPEQVKVNIEIAPALPSLYVDSRQIGQVLVNLITNAHQAMPKGGELTIEAKSVKGEVHLSIRDTGCGISKENMENLFEPLFTTKARGIGFGLALSKNLAEANGGSVEVKSELGEGSTFTIILPARAEVS